jgi:hypothetical protein
LSQFDEGGLLMEIELLNEDRLRYWCNRIDIPGEAINELAQVAETVKQSGLLLRIFTDFHEKTAVRDEWHREWSEPPVDPRIQAIFGERTSMFYLLAYLAALPYTEREYLRRGINPDIFHDTMLDFAYYIGDAYELDGRWGYHHFMWIWRHLSCKLFRLGRLQFMLKPFEDKIAAFRNKKNGRIQLLADPGVTLRSDGYALGAGKLPKEARPYLPEQHHEEIGWLPIYEETENGWKGNPISPYGFVLKDSIFLAQSEWEQVLRQSDIILDIHIPRKEQFSVNACRESIDQAYRFFNQQFPEQPFRALFCHTWFFTIQLQQILPPPSNIVRFQREFYLYPFPGSLGFLWSFVFGDGKIDLENISRDTSLQRSVLEWIESGKELFDLPGLYFQSPSEWGNQLYMSQWDSLKQ